MDTETVKYIITYFSNLFTAEERIAMKHSHHLIKIGYENGNPAINDHVKQIYIRNGWLTEDESILDLLKGGQDNFELNIANRILKQHPDKVFFNLCPVCNRLARTPQAKQCRYCGHDWHKG